MGTRSTPSLAIARRFLGALVLAQAVAAAGWAGHDWFDYDFKPDQILERDVVVAGGGASGSHAAVRLREDFGKSVLVVEKMGRMGGHTATYQDEKSGAFYNFGIQTFIDYGGARKFVERFNITTGTLPRVSLNRTYVDFETGKVVKDYIPPPTNDSSAALNKYTELARQYADYLAPGFWNFPEPGDIPEDLSMPFSDFVAKYKLEAMVPAIFEITVMGLGDPMPVPTMYVMQAFGAPIQGSGSFNPISGNNMELYQKIEKLLGADVRLNSIIGDSRRSDDGVELVVIDLISQTATLVKAKRLLIAFEPVSSNMNFLDTDDQEMAVFNKWEWTDVQCGIVKHSSLPVGVSLDNTPQAAAPRNYLELPKMPFVARYDWMGQDYFRILMVGDKAYNEWKSLNQMDSTVKRMLKTDEERDEDVTLVAFMDHGPMHLHVGTEELKKGFIQDQYALQGLRSTWYTGAAWSMQFTTVLWEFNEVLLPKLLKGL